MVGTQGTMEKIISLVIVGGVTLFIFGVCAWVIKQHWLDKRWINESSSFIGRTIYEEMQNADAKECIQHVIYQEEQECEENFGGEKPKPGEEEVEIEYKNE